ncbi:hypothetical protein K493DRAFT_76650 [Basidiobolus meristosporus CBS 931.73]|uniref:Zn(2)-C6 fungal-type domain-containing protein n=1 Tax=Basidiobolus meristosporus CBS 931.73 TaxID=1314790 RepID=A0A1Y1XSD3_9FUNG|nr:hypothetical protein K493DRAFT_76650 [Basidiobolus meristosporus CBS 931.73]|eukprot:ORX88661.1 hypothetical protein K493DRAFT_76650 [Basidiobolus meristosporus CBS 931.73]
MKTGTIDESNTVESTPTKSKTMRACDICRRKKVKCDVLKPACTNCAMFGYECTFLDVPKKRGPQASDSKALERRLKRIEAALATLLDNDSHSSPEPAAAADLGLPSNAGTSSHKREMTFVQESSDSEEMENTNDKLTKLTITDGSGYRYVGSSSGMYLLEGGKYHVNGVFRKFMCDIKNMKLPKLPESNFPSQETKDKLIEVYFTRSHPYFPVFNKARFLERLNSGEKIPEVLMNAIFAVGCVLEGLTVFKTPEISRSATVYFFKEAKSALDKQYTTSNLHTIQGLLLMSFNPMGGWLFLGIAIRMAQDLGLHRNLESENLDPIEKQNRKLAWWGCVIFDRFHSALGGKPLAINEEDFDTTLPLELNQGELSPEINRSIRFLAQSVRMTMLISKIIQTIYVLRGDGRIKASSNLWSLNKSLSDWEASIPPEFRVDYHSRTISTPHGSLLHTFYQYSVILLNRPFIPIHNNASTQINPAQLICQRAASRITWIAYHTPLEWMLHGNPARPGLMFSASAIHLINAMSKDSELARVARNNFAVNLAIMKRISDVFFGAGHVSAILEDLAKVRGLTDLDMGAEPILYDPPSVALSPDVSEKLPPRNDTSSVVVLPAFSEVTSLKSFYDEANPDVQPPAPSQECTGKCPVLNPNESNGNICLDDPITQLQQPTSFMPHGILEDTMNFYPPQQMPPPSISQLPTMCEDATLLPNDSMQGYPTSGSNHDAPLLNLLQIEIDFNDWNNYLNQFGQPSLEQSNVNL